MNKMVSLNTYFNAIKQFVPDESTEHTLRGPLENLLKIIAADANPNITIIHEPKRDRTKLGAPDFKIKLHETTVGYLETKPIDENLDKVLKSDQIKKYIRLSDNIILTNYLEWIWLRGKNGDITRRETLCYLTDVGNRRAHLDPDKAEKVTRLIDDFLSVPPSKLDNSKTLSRALAVRCNDLRNFILEELIRQEKEHRERRLYGLYEIFKKEVFQELELREFADAFSQTLGYGLFLAKFNAGEQVAITLINAKTHIPTNFALLRELVGFLDELDQDDYKDIRWLVEEILNIMNTLDLTAICQDLAFSKKTDRPHLTKDEQYIFAKDPYVYFYENFLKEYDPKTRKVRGVYYTPPPVVIFIIRAINDILKFTFNINDGFADRRYVTVLDFATGTGTFLLEVLYHILETVPKEIHDLIIKEHILKNLYGFECLIAPYAVAHLKLSQFLQEKGYVIQSGERLNIFLTNTLEPIEPQKYNLLPALSHEVEAAQEIKDTPVLVITGNPPYLGESKNKGKWITDLIETYKSVDGERLHEKNLKWLQDDYVKFIRFAQSKMEESEEGVVGIITNHSYLDNPTFRGMRRSLMQTFHQIYVLNLHGSAKKIERPPENGKDENVFDIEQGVAISLLVKKQGLEQKIYHADLWGTRSEKYRMLIEADKDFVDWQELEPSAPFYLFIPHDEEFRDEYEQGWKVKDIFPVNSMGIVTARDKLTINHTKDELWGVINNFSDLSVEEARQYYKLKPDSRDWKVEFAQKDLKESGLSEDNVFPIAYRPFDNRYTYYTGNSRGFHCMPRGNVMRHMLSGENLALLCTRQISSLDWKHVGISEFISDNCAISNKTKERNYAFPLYLYPSSEIQTTGSVTLLKETDSCQKKERIENLNPKLRAFMDTHYKHRYRAEEILGYVYAVLHSPTYRQRYFHFLKIDSPRIPFVKKRKTFETLATLGWELIQVHLLKKITNTLSVAVSSGNFKNERLRYDPKNERLYINSTQYFAPVPQDILEFRIGSYQVLEKYLKDRKGKTLSLDEIENTQNIVNALHFTANQMKRIDEHWKP